MCCFLRGGTFAAPNIPISRSEGLQTWQRRDDTSDEKKKKTMPNQRRLTPSCKLSADAVVVGGVEGDGVRGRSRQAGGRQRVAFQHHGQRHAHWNGSAGCFKKQCFSSIFSQSCYSVAELRFFNLHLSALAIHTQINGTEEDSRGF